MPNSSQQSTKNTVLLLFSVVMVGSFAVFVFAVLGYVCSQVVANAIYHDLILQQKLPDL